MKKEHLDLLVIFFLGLLPLLWFKGDRFILDADANFRLDLEKAFYERSYAWNYVFQTGTDHSLNFSTLPYIGLQMLLFKIFGLLYAEKISYCILFMLPGFSMYFFINQVYLDKPWSRIAALSGAFFYMYNFYQLFIWPRLILATGALFLIPIYLAILFNWLNNKMRFKRDLLLLSTTTIIGSSIGLQPPLIGVFFTLFFGYSFFHLIILKKSSTLGLSTSIKRVFLIVTIFFLISSFWFIPTINYVVQSNYVSSDHAKTVFNTDSLLSFASKHSNFLNVVSFQGDVFWYESWGNQPYNPWFETFRTNKILIFLSFFFPLFALSTIFLKKDKMVAFFSLFALIFIFLSKGTQPPFDKVFLWLYNNIPFFWVYRAPWQKFSMGYLICFSFLIGTNIGRLYEKIKIKKLFFQSHRIFLITIFLINLTFLYPLILGYNFPYSEGEYGFHQYYDLGFHHNVPSYVFDTSKWINFIDKKFNMFVYPEDTANVYNWGYGGGTDLSLMLINKGLIFRQYGEGMAPPNSIEELYKIITKEIYSSKSRNVYKLLGLMNVKYILQRNDFRYNFYGDTDSPHFIQTQLSKQKNINKAKSFGKWDLYEINPVNSHIYSPDEIINIKGHPFLLSKIIDCPEFTFKTNFLLNDEKNIISNFRNETLYFDFEKINLKIENDFNFSENNVSYKAVFYPGWKTILKKTENKTELLDFFSLQSDTLLEKDFEWKAFESTLIYIENGNQNVTLHSIIENQNIVTDIVGIWTETKWAGMGLKKIKMPFIIPKNEKALIQINHKLSDFSLNYEMDSKHKCELKKHIFEKKPLVEFREINPTKFEISVKNATNPFLLVFSENFHPQWKAFIRSSNPDAINILKSKPKNNLFPISDIKYITKTYLSEKKHFISNGYSNGWIINPIEHENNFEITLIFYPQLIFYLSLILSSLTYFCILIFAFFDYPLKFFKKSRISS